MRDRTVLTLPIMFHPVRLKNVRIGLTRQIDKLVFVGLSPELTVDS